MPIITAVFESPYRVTKPDIIRAKKDYLARRFYNKNYVTAGDLMGAVSFWIGSGMPKKSLHDFLSSIEPQSGWVEAENYNSEFPTQRLRHEYGSAIQELMNGYWSKWK